MLKALGWILKNRYLTFAWTIVIFIAIISGCGFNESSSPMTTSSTRNEQTKTVQSTTKDPEQREIKNENDNITATQEKSSSKPTASSSQESNLQEKNNSKAITESNLKYDVILYFPADKYPETASHIQSAIEKGESPVCTIDRDGADENRKESLDDVPVKEGYDRDEWPMAFCEEGGEGADVAYIDPSDNRGAGSWVGNQLEDFPDGTRVLFVVSDDKDGIEVVNATIKEKISMSSESEIAATKEVEEDKQVEPPSKGKAKTVYYANCTEVRNAGAAPLYEGDPGYSRKLDRDGDGVACE